MVDRQVEGCPKFPIHRLENSPTIAATTGTGSYSVMQSYGSSFWGDVVLYSFNVAYMEEVSILTKNMKSKSSEIIIINIFIFETD